MATVFSDTPMSTTSGTSPSATSTCLSTGAICGFANSPGTLYLFTFLSTLLLLTLVSGGIISRSMYLRRRQQRLMASGAWAPPTRRTAMTLEASLRNKPTMYEVNLSLVAPEDLRYWDGMQPLAAAYRRPAARPIPVPAEVAYSVNNPGETRPSPNSNIPRRAAPLGVYACRGEPSASTARAYRHDPVARNPAEPAPASCVCYCDADRTFLEWG
ncbi:hypothetical protein B0H16DRAFT_1892552 [Mycena metata]|uniref:Uncharacterized protein n=1 Tax=Mycena metata TaxID=1033252 RepID=A0AAD7I4Y5_9AGAR|nr:hypothetical protein B0H16DRAFT_1892552 [Mycena metata]